MPFPMSRFDSAGVRVNRACIAETPFMLFNSDRVFFYHNSRVANRRKFGRVRKPDGCRLINGCKARPFFDILTACSQIPIPEGGVPEGVTTGAVSGCCLLPPQGLKKTIFQRVGKAEAAAVHGEPFLLFLCQNGTMLAGEDVKCHCSKSSRVFA